jgi:selenocysteine lyase/cysteine desulfurase
MLSTTGLDNVRSAILEVRDHLHGRLREAGFAFLSPDEDDPMRSGILTCRHPGRTSGELFAMLEEQGIVASLRSLRDGSQWLRFSPHFYNTIDEMDRVAGVLARAVA